MNPFAFDPAALPSSYLRFLRIVTTIGSLLLAAVAVWGYVMAQRALDGDAKDAAAMLRLLEFFFFFAVTGVSAAGAVLAGFVSVRCWLQI